MIICKLCKNEDKQRLFQHDASLAGYEEYGWFFTCLKCKENFILTSKDASYEEIIGFNKQWKKKRDEQIINNDISTWII